MASGRTISASFLTDFDKQIINLCDSISQIIIEQIQSDEDKKDFKENFGKTSKSRDSGAGRGAGKLQRDAICTRGIQGKAPFSNRNLRWHPLLISNDEISFAKAIERIEIEGTDESQTLIFVVKIGGKEFKFTSSEVYKLPERFVTLPRHWEPLINQLQYWNDNLWTQNSCIITAYEACNWYDAVEAYAVLGMSIAVDKYNVNFDILLEKIKIILQNQEIDTFIKLPTIEFPTNKEEIINCPLCKVKKTKNPSNLPDRKREDRFKFAFSGNKRNEGDDSSMQIMHVEPLTETEIRHKGKNVRFGHRWCNIAMTDHSIEETVDFMRYIVKAHEK
jgi:hypothetical protein